MVYADFLGFLLSQKQFIERQNVALEKDIPLHLCQVTSAPPYVKTVEEILNWHRWLQGALQEASTQMQLLYGLQHPPEDANVHDLEYLREAGIQFMTLAYLGKSVFGGGFTTPNEPLTDKGKKMLCAMADVGMILDLSHVGHRTAREALACIRAGGLPLEVVVTHAGCFDVFPHLRNFPDNILTEIACMDGMIGISAMTWMLHAYINSIEPLMLHITHAVRLLGEDQVCIGSDCIYRTMGAEVEYDNFVFLNNALSPSPDAPDPFQVRFPDRPEELKGPNRLELLYEIIGSRLGSRVAEKIVGRNLFSHFGKEA